MSKHHLISDMKLVINGLQKVISSNLAVEKAAFETKLRNSSIDITSRKDFPVINVLFNDPKNAFERASMVPLGVQGFIQHAILPKFIQDSKVLQTQNEVLPEEDILVIREEDLEGIYIQSLGVELLEDTVEDRPGGKIPKPILHEHVATTGKSFGQENVMTQFETASPVSIPIQRLESNVNQDFPTLDKIVPHVTVTPGDEIKKAGDHTAPTQDISLPKGTTVSGFDTFERRNMKPLSQNKPESRLGASSRERKVPASRIGRLVSYGGLAAGLGIGAMAEVTKRSLGLVKDSSDGVSVLDTNPFLNDANAERIVDTLCRVRGAALKLGQILSIQDDTMINPKLQQIFERVRHAADFMPEWQMKKMMEAEFGNEWKSKLLEFDMKPFAAASIGQVHLGKLMDGRPVAVKVQYPGVAQGIESDIDNLMSVLSIWKILPDGIFADNIILVAKRELRWEVDYIREMECAKRFKVLLEPYPDYYVPEVIEEFTTKLVYTTELIEGIPVDKCDTLDQETRDRICFLMLDLFFRELFEFKFMQTDPNWSNFLYNVETKQIGLLDFGASREYSQDFADKYLRILKGAATEDEKLVLEVSREIGFLTGYESKTMEKAHVDTVMILGEPFRVNDEPYDFGKQKITQRVQDLVPAMVRERLCPPPEEIYSLHRKLSGMFLLCARLKGRVRCRPIFERVWHASELSKSNS